MQALEADKQANQERVKLADDTLREISIWEIAAEYESGDPVKLKDLCDTFLCYCSIGVKILNIRQNISYGVLTKRGRLKRPLLPPG